MPVNAIITPIERINKEHVSIITPIKKYSPTNVGLTAIPTNVNKYNKKLEKSGIKTTGISSKAAVSTKNVNINNDKQKTQKEKDEAIADATAYYSKNAKPGSIASKANMVKQYNEKNNKN